MDNLLLTEALIVALVISGLCQIPKEWPDRAGACAATLLVLPCANVLSPLACIAGLAGIATQLRGVHKGREKVRRARDRMDAVTPRRPVTPHC